MQGCHKIWLDVYVTTCTTIYHSFCIKKSVSFSCLFNVLKWSEILSLWGLFLKLTWYLLNHQWLKVHALTLLFQLLFQIFERSGQSIKPLLHSFVHPPVNLSFPPLLFNQRVLFTSTCVKKFRSPCLHYTFTAIFRSITIWPLFNVLMILNKWIIPWFRFNVTI